MRYTILFAILFFAGCFLIKGSTEFMWYTAATLIGCLIAENLEDIADSIKGKQ